MTNKTCGRCKKNFDCNAENISACSCFSVSLSQASRAYLAKTSYNCLCTSCLTEINVLIEKVQKNKFSPQLEAGSDFYYENGLMVFTEYYHLKRGSCCNSSCRHCAYGFKKS